MFRWFRSSRKRKFAVLGVVASMALAGVAIAYFTDTGSGTGNAAVGTSTPWTVTQTSTTGTMYPGYGTSTIDYSVKNGGSGVQHLNATTATVANDGSGNIVQGPTNTPVVGCLATWFTATNTPPAAGDVNPGSTVTGSVAVVMANAAVTQDACKNALPNITISAS